jgi:CheY-like chemotaxis protein
VALIIETMLRYYGYDILRATSAAEGLQLAAQRRPLAVVTELELQDANVPDLCDALHQHAHGQPLIIIGFTSDPDEFGPADRAGLSDVVRKPNFEQLVNAVGLACQDPGPTLSR